MRHVDPTLNKKKKNHTNQRKTECREKREGNIFFYFFYFFSHFSFRYTEIGQSEFVGARSKVLYSMKATRGNKKHGISPSF